jgi:hypothetical protein
MARTHQCGQLKYNNSLFEPNQQARPLSNVINSNTIMFSTLIQYTTEPLLTGWIAAHTAGTENANKNFSISFPIPQEKNFSTPTPPTPLMNKKMTATTVHSVCTNHAPEQHPMHSAASLRHMDKPTAGL